MKLQLLMVLGSGLFAAGTVAAASRTRAWLAMDLSDFKRDFGRTITIADKVQPALVVLTLAAILAFVVGSTGSGEGYAVGSGVALLSILIGSVAILVPLQRRIMNKTDSIEAAERLRRRWIKGHWGRTAVAIVAFASALLAYLS